MGKISDTYNQVKGQALCKLVATRETEKAIEFVPAKQPGAVPRWVPKSVVADMTEHYSVGQGEILDVFLPKWKAQELGWWEP